MSKPLRSRREDTDVQSRDASETATPWLVLGNDEDNTEEITERVVLDVRPEDLDFAKSYASYRNLLAKVQGRKLKIAWSRKSMVESWISNGAKAQRDALREMLEAVGPMPSGDLEHRDEMEKYVRRVLAWDKKKNSQSK